MPSAAPKCKSGRHREDAKGYQAVLPCIASQLAVALVLVLMGYLICGWIPDEQSNPLNRWLIAAYGFVAQINLARNIPNPRRNYGMATVVGVPGRVKRLRMAARSCNSATWRSKSRAMTRSPSSLKQRILVSTRLPAAGAAVPAHVLVQPNQQLAARFQRRVVFLPVGRSVLRFYRGTHAVSLPAQQLGRWRRGFVQQSLAGSQPTKILPQTDRICSEKSA